MQGVDRIDQLRGRFSIADGHTFKKWHKKLAMAEIDIAVCNAYIARKMTGVYKTARDPHREFMIELSSELIHGGWNDALGDEGMLFSEPNAQNAPRTPLQSSPRPASPGRVSIECVFRNSKDVFDTQRAKRQCVVCRFEGRYASEQTVFCLHHKVPVCSTVHEANPVRSYMCPNTKTTCWAKFHSFYYPAGLFNVNGNISRSCSLFKEMKQAQVHSDTSSSGYLSDSSGPPDTPFSVYRPEDSQSDNSSLDFGVSPITAPATVIQSQASNTLQSIRVGSIVEL
jgi:hypothetical protein